MYAPGDKLARGLGWFSIGLGAAEVLTPRAVGRVTGVRSTGLLSLYGLREIACGVGILSSARPAGWMWARVAGDVLDLATLGTARAQENGTAGKRTCWAATAVLGVMALDAICGAQLSAAAALEG